MSILRERQVWKRAAELPKRQTARMNELTREEQANVRHALAVLRVRHGSFKEVAAVMGVNRNHLTEMANGNEKPGAGLAIRVARVAGVPVDDVLSGAFPRPGSCPMCGRTS